jgi:endo-1,4-beta-xylanase
MRRKQVTAAPGRRKGRSLREAQSLSRVLVLGSLVAALFAITPLQASAQEPVLVLSNGFEDGTTQGWFGRGSAQVAVSDQAANSGAASLLTTDRAATWQGPGLDVLPVLQPGVTYQIEASVRLADAASADLHMTVQRTPTGGDTAFERVASGVTATDSGWVQVAGGYSFDSEANDELQLYLESDDPAVSFYLDDVRITTTELPDEVIAATGFEDGTAQGWSARGEETVAPTQDDAFAGDWSLLASGRTQGWNGPAFNLTSLVEPGTTYGFSLHLKLAPGEDPAELRVSLQTDQDGESSFANLIPNTEVTADTWVEFSGTWTPAGAADAFILYAESASSLASFYLDEFVLTGVVPPEIEDIPGLYEVLSDHFPVGTAIDARETTGASAELLTRHFNSITAENHMKPEAIQPTEGEFTFQAADELVSFADANNLRVYGHTLVWHSQTPDWFFQDGNGEPLTGDDPADRDLLLSRMQAHIQAIADHYGDRMWAWDVVNEAIDEGQEDGLRRSPWYNIIGPDYLAQAFQFARDAFGPDVKLFLNDYNTEFPAKREAMFDVVEGLIADGVPIDGVGHQLHLNLVRPPSLVDDTITRFEELPVIQAVTELDVAIQESASEDFPAPPEDRVIRQGYYYRDLFDILRAHSDVLESVTAWGLHDGRSWLRNRATPRPWEAPLFFDDQLQSKPAYWGVVDPDQLPHFPQALNVSGGTVVVDGERDVEWDLLQPTVLRAGEDGGADTGFQLRWDADHLYVFADVADPAADAGDAVELYVDDTNAKAGDYQEGDAHYLVGRDGSATGEPAASAVTETAFGFRVEAALPLATPGELGRAVGFDIRITDGATGDQVSWSDQSHEQDTDTSRWGTLTLIEAVDHVEIPHTTATPAVDGEIEAAWDTAVAVRTDVLVEGSADGAKADVRLLWDEQRLYVLAEVTDSQLDAGSSNPWEQDSVEIFVDPDNAKNGPFLPADGQYRINFENDQSVSGDLDVIGENLTSAAAVTGDGYLIEASIALTTPPSVGSFIGLELQVNDGTDGVRTAVHTWHDPTGQSFQNTTRWGVARLVEAPLVCDQTVDGVHRGPLTTGDTLCLAEGATVEGPITIQPGGSLAATGAHVYGPIFADGAETVRLVGNTLIGPVMITGTTGELVFSGNTVRGPVNLSGNSTNGPIIVSANTIVGLLACTGNQPVPTNDGASNQVLGLKSGQCMSL